MRIGLYITALHGGGAERVVSRLSYILSSNGEDVYVILADKTDMAYDVWGTVVDLNCPSSNSKLHKSIILLNRVRKLKSVKRLYKLECVVSFMEGANIVNAMAKCPECSTFLSIRNYSDAESSGFGSHVKSKIYSQTEGIIACSKLIQENMQAQPIYRNTKISFLYNPFDINEFQKLSLSDADEMYRAFADKHDFTLVSTGRLQHQKGFWHLVKIVSGLKKKGINVGCFIIGDGEQREMLSALAKKMGVSDQICFCGFQRNPFAIEKLADAYIMTSLHEGFPNALVEAMTIGLPIITADCKSGPSEIVTKSNEILFECECDQGMLLPVLESDEDWSAELSEGDKIWANCIFAMPFERLSAKSTACCERAQVFSYDRCYSRLIQIIQGTME